MAIHKRTSGRCSQIREYNVEVNIAYFLVIPYGPERKRTNWWDIESKVIWWPLRNGWGGMYRQRGDVSSLFLNRRRFRTSPRCLYEEKGRHWLCAQVGFGKLLKSLINRLCGLVVRVLCCWPRGPGYDSRRYHIFWVAVSLERGPLRLARITEELLERKSSGSGLETWE
jgi:hypothetical protein